MRTILLIFVAILLLPSFANATELSVSVPSLYQTLTPGDTLNFQLSIKEKEISGRHDVDFVYEIRDEKNALLAVSKETKAIETQASFLSALAIPLSAVDGRHTITVRVNQTETSASFYVVAKEEDPVETYLLIVVSVILLVFSLILWELNIIRKKLKR